MSDDFEYTMTAPEYNVNGVAISIFYEMIRQEMKSLWYTEPKERKAMVHECFMWAKDFCDECKNYKEKDDE